MAGLARALKHGPRRSFGKSRHTDEDILPKIAPVTKPKPKQVSKLSSDEKEEKTGGFLFRRRSFNDKKSTADDDSNKGSPKVGKKFGIKIGGSGNKKPPIKSKPVFSTSSSAGENDSIVSEDISHINSTTSTPSKMFDPKQEESPKTSTPYKEDSTPPSRRERTPNERDSSLFKDPPPLFGHRSVLFGSNEFDAIFEKYSKDTEEEASKVVEPTDDSSETKQQSNRKSTPDRKPTPSKKPETAAKPNWRDRSSTSSDKSSEEKSSISRVLEGRAMFERPKLREETPPKKVSARKGFGGVFSKYESNTHNTETKKEEEKTKMDEVKKSKEDKTKENKEEKAEIKEDKKVNKPKDEDSSSSTKTPLFEDDHKVELMETNEVAVETKDDKVKSLFDKYEAASVVKHVFKDIDGKDDKPFGDKDEKETPVAKTTVYDSLFSEEQTSSVQRSGSLFDEESSDDELFKKPKKKDDSLEVLDLNKSRNTTLADKKTQEAKVSSPLDDEDESPLFGKPKSLVAELFSKEEEKDKKVVEDDALMDVDKDKIESKVKNEKEDTSPGLFNKPASPIDKPTSPLFEDKSEVQRSTSIFEGKRSKSEDELFQMEQERKDPDVKELTVASGYLLVDVEKNKDETTRSSLIDDNKLLFDDSDVLPKLEKEIKEKNDQFNIDDFVLVPKEEEMTSESLTVEETSTDPISDDKKEMALEDFPPKQLMKEDEPPSVKEKESDEVSMDSDKSKSSRVYESSAETVQAAVEKKKNMPSKEEKKSSADDKPAWMIEAQRRKERRLLEKEKEKERKLQGAKESSATKKSTSERSKPPLIDTKLKKSSNISTTTSVTKKTEDDMPEWQKKLMERKQRVADQKRTVLSSKETTYTSQRGSKETATTTTTAATTLVEDNKVEEKEEKEAEQGQSKDEQKEKSKSPIPSPLQDKPLLSPKPKIKSPTRTISVSSSKPELKKKPSVEVTISSTKRHPSDSSAEQRERERSKESPVKEPEKEPEKDPPLSRRRIPSGSDKKTVSVSSRVTTSVSSTRNGNTLSDSSVPKWKRDLQQKKMEPDKKEKVGRDTVVSPTSQDSVPEWKRQLLEKRKQRRTPTPTDDKEVREKESTVDDESLE